MRLPPWKPCWRPRRRPGGLPLSVCTAFRSSCSAGVRPRRGSSRPGSSTARTRSPDTSSPAAPPWRRRNAWRSAIAPPPSISCACARRLFGACGVLLGRNLPRAVRTALAAGDRALAERLAGSIEPLQPLCRHAVAAAQALVMEARGEREAAAESFADAASGLTTSVCPTKRRRRCWGGAAACWRSTGPRGRAPAAAGARDPRPARREAGSCRNRRAPREDRPAWRS